MSEQLIRDLGEILPEERTKGWRCPSELKGRTISYAQVCREQGEPIDDIAERLGLVTGTLARWLRRDRGEAAAGFRSVAIVAAGDDSDRTIDGPMRLISPRGYCVEGLDAQTLAFLLRVVG